MQPLTQTDPTGTAVGLSPVPAARAGMKGKKTKGLLQQE